MPPSSTGEDTSSSSSSGTDSKPKFVVAQSGHAAHPDDIVASCQALTAHVQKIQVCLCPCQLKCPPTSKTDVAKNDSDALFQKWQADIQARDLAEKRRVAPGWLDRNEKILEPLRKASDSNVMDMLDDEQQQADAKGLRLRGMKGLVERRDEEGEAMDRAFGGLSVQ